MKFFFTFDPFENNKWNRDQLKKLLAVFSSKEDEITATYVASRAEVQLTTAYDVPEKERFSKYPESLIKNELKEIGFSTAKVKVLKENSLSQTEAVKQLAAAAKKEKADLIVISTNAKSLLPRIVFGSFAETLVHQAKNDLLIYHQKTKVSANGNKTIIFAHDLSLKGEKGLNRACEYAEKWNAKLIVVYVGLPDEQEGSLARKMQLRLKKAEKQLAQWDIDYEIIKEYSWDDTPSIIMDIANTNKAALIALAAGAVHSETLLGGSVVRKVLRESNIPTLVLKV